MLLPSKPGRPRPVFVGMIGAVMIAVIVWIVWPAASQPSVPSNQRVQRTPAEGQLCARWITPLGVKVSLFR